MSSAQAIPVAAKDSPDLPRRVAHIAPSRVLICRPNSRLGNALLLTPLVQELEQTFPGAEIDVLTAFPAAEEVFRPFSSVRVIHQLPYHGAAHLIRQTLAFVRAFRTRYDLIIDPCPRSWSSRFAARVLRAQWKIGFSSPQKRDRIDFSLPIQAVPEHMAAYPVHLVRRAFSGSHPVSGVTLPKLSLRLSASERQFGRHKCAQLIQRRSGPTLGVSTRATGTKQFAVQWWEEMVSRVAILVPAVNVIEILSASGKAGLPQYPGYFSTHLRRVAAVINAMDCYVSADSGLMHLGSATAAATIGLFKVTDPAVYAPYGGRNRALSAGDLDPAQVAQRVADVLLERDVQVETTYRGANTAAD